MELQIPRTFSSRKRDYERLGMTVPAVFLLYDTSQIVLDGFLHHIFQRNSVLGSDLAAIFVFWRIIGYCPVHAGNFQAYIAPLRAHRDPLPRQRLTALIATAHAKSRGLGENNLREPGCIFWFYQNRQQHSGTTLFHLHGNPKYIQRSFLQQTIHDVAEDLRVQIVQIRLENRDYLLRRVRRRLAVRFSNTQANHVSVTREISRTGSVADFLNLHSWK